MEYNTYYRTRYGLNYMLVPKSDLSNFVGYDNTIARTHIANVGCIVTYDGYEPIDNEYDLDAIYAQIEENGVF